jgi:hypothetical protein
LNLPLLLALGLRTNLLLGPVFIRNKLILTDFTAHKPNITYRSSPVKQKLTFEYCLS